MRLIFFLSVFLLVFAQKKEQKEQAGISPFFLKSNITNPVNYGELRLKAHSQLQKKNENAYWKNLQWDNIGPTIMGGRVTDIAVPKNSYFTFYIATAAGGVWKTSNNGTSWQCIFQNEASISIGDIALDEQNENVIWVGTGENNSLRSSYAGTGVYKSSDLGKTWQHMGLKESQHIGRIIVDPTNSDVVYVAVIGNLYSYSEDRGLYKTVNGGKTWEKILYIDNKTGFIDVSFAPGNASIIYAASWERSRRAWNFVESGAGSGIYKSSDAGKSWSKKTSGFPNDQFVGRIGFGTSKSNANVVYAVLDNQRMKSTATEEDKKRVSWATSNKVDSVISGIEVYRSNDFGETFKLVSSNLNNGEMYSSYGYFFGNMGVDQNNADILYTMGVQMSKSIDGGKTWNVITEGAKVHGDHHAIWINPNNSNHIINGNDGGINLSYDAGASWQSVENLPIAQFYMITSDKQANYYVYGGLQDNGTWRGPANYGNASADIMGLTNNNDKWEFLYGGDGFYAQVDPTDHNTFYAESQWGYIGRSIAGNTTEIQPRSKVKGERYRFNWNSPILLSEHNRLTLYFGGNKLFKSLNQGDSWLEISPDLSKQDSTKKGDVTFGTITSISESSLDPLLLYVGTDDANVWCTKDGGINWNKITSGLPNKWVTRVIASRYDHNLVYVTLSGYREDDFQSYAFKSINNGTTWSPLSNDLPIEPINVIREDYKNKNVLYLGTDLSAYLSEDAGATWQSLRNNLPTVPINDIHQNAATGDVLLATHGRSIYKLKASLISSLSDSLKNLANYVYDLEAVNFDYGMSVKAYYTLKSDETVKIDILDKNKKVFKNLSSEKQNSGLHSIFWDAKKLDAKSQYDLVEKEKYYILFTFGKKKIEKEIIWK